MSTSYSVKVLAQKLSKFHWLSKELNKNYEFLKDNSSWDLVTNWGANENVTVIVNVMIGAFLKKHGDDSITWLTADEKKKLTNEYTKAWKDALGKCKFKIPFSLGTSQVCH